jgi:hypothetical protein
MRNITDRPPGHTPRMSRRLDRASELAIAGLLVFVFIGALAVLAALVPVGHGFVPKGGGWFIPAVAGGAFTLHPLLIVVPSAACFVLGLLDWRRPWRVEHLDLLALAGFFPVAMLLSDDFSQVDLWLAAVCLGWLFSRMLGAAFGVWRMPELRPSISSRWLGLAIVILPVLAAALVLLALSPMVRPGGQGARQHAALAAALLIGVQLLLGYWFYNYLIWFYPLLLVAVIQSPRAQRGATTLTDSTGSIDAPHEAQLLLAAAGTTAYFE